MSVEREKMAKILIIDDQPYIRETVSEELGDEGYEVAVAADVTSVEKDLVSARPDLVLLDLYLEGMDGFKVLREIKVREPGLPVIIFTAYDSYLDDPRLARADGYVIKSADFGELKRKIKDVLRQKQQSLPKGESG